MEITERFALHTRLWDRPRRWGGGGLCMSPSGLCMEADFFFHLHRAKGCGLGTRGTRRASAGTAQPGWPRPSLRPSVCPSVPLALPGDVMLERKHTRSLNTSSPLQRSDAGADGCGDRQLCSGSSSLGAVMWPEGCSPPGGAGRVMHPPCERLQNMQRAGLGKRPRWESELGQLAGSEQLPALASEAALTFECVFCT